MMHISKREDKQLLAPKAKLRVWSSQRINNNKVKFLKTWLNSYSNRCSRILIWLIIWNKKWESHSSSFYFGFHKLMICTKIKNLSMALPHSFASQLNVWLIWKTKRGWKVVLLWFWHTSLSKLLIKSRTLRRYLISPKASTDLQQWLLISLIWRFLYSRF